MSKRTLLNSLQLTVSLLMVSGLAALLIFISHRYNRKLDFAATLSPASSQNPVVKQAPTVDIVSLTKFSGFQCNPKYAPKGDKFLCYTMDNEKHELWLASETNGMEKLILPGPVLFDWYTDDQHILYSPWSLDPKDFGRVQPVFILNVQTGESKEIGKTTQGWLMQALPSGEVALLNNDTLQIINVDTGGAKQVPIKFGAEHMPVVEPIGPLVSTEQAEIPDYLQSQKSESTEKTATDGTPVEPRQSENPNLKVIFDVSPDGKKVVAYQFAYTQGTITIIDVDTPSEKTILTKHAGNTGHSFSWSSDSRRLVYGMQSKDDLPQLRLVNADGTNGQLLATEKWAGIYDFVEWLPEQENVVYEYLMKGTDTAESAVYQMSSTMGGEPKPSFRNGYGLNVSDHGRRLTFSRARAENKTDIGFWIVKLSN